MSDKPGFIPFASINQELLKSLQKYGKTYLITYLPEGVQPTIDLARTLIVVGREHKKED